MAKRKRSSAVVAPMGSEQAPPPSLASRMSRRKPSASVLDPKTNGDVFDGPSALRASPDSDDANEKVVPGELLGVDVSDPSLLEVSDETDSRSKSSAARETKVTKPDHKFDEMVLAAATRKSALKRNAPAKVNKDEQRADPEAEDEDDEADPMEIKEALSRPPPVNSDYLPLPWKGRLGYACLCTYLRNSNPTVFQSRTTRIASILEHRHPLKDPTQPEHPTKNRPDKEKPADVRLGQQFVEQLCLANCRDMVKMLRWNDRYNVKFLRLSSEAFPFASHAEYGYKLAPFASEALAEVGKVVAELGHRVTTHPGQFTQLGSPRKPVIDASMRDLAYHDEMLSLLKLPEQQDRDAVLVLHMGGVFGDKEATLDRFRENYQKLTPSIKNRLVLENDDVSWSVHDLLPVCQELNIPLVLDFHHHNIIFDADEIREGTKDIIELFPEIRATWTRKRITQKMHYSEPTPSAITPKQRRKHSPRVATLPPCPDDMDLMIEAKDKEQAVFELMRVFKLPGHDLINDIQPHIRRDDNKPVRTPKAKPAAKKRKGEAAAGEGVEDDDSIVDMVAPQVIPEEEVGMGGPDGRVYWPPGMEDWLRPVKKVVQKKVPASSSASSGNKATSAKTQVKTEEATADDLPPPSTKVKRTTNGVPPEAKAESKQNTLKSKKISKKTKVAPEPTPPSSDEEIEEAITEEESAEEKEVGDHPPSKAKRGESFRKSSRAKRAKVSYKEEEDDHEADEMYITRIGHL